MFKEIIEAVKAMWAKRREVCYFAFGYIVFMLAFFFIGITKAQFNTFAALVLLTGVYALLAWFVKKIAD